MFDDPRVVQRGIGDLVVGPTGGSTAWTSAAGTDGPIWTAANRKPETRTPRRTTARVRWLAGFAAMVEGGVTRPVLHTYAALAS